LLVDTGLEEVEVDEGAEVDEGVEVVEEGNVEVLDAMVASEMTERVPAAGLAVKISPRPES
jgi:hypothetical protein